jgi:hypothetical protein
LFDFVTPGWHQRADELISFAFLFLPVNFASRIAVWGHPTGLQRKLHNEQRLKT